MITLINRLRRFIEWLRGPDRLAIFGLLGLLFTFYPELFLVKAAPLTGDHLEQHYPWAYVLAQSVKEFKLPFWTPLIHCGFPLVAESQVGAFYIPNLLMYFFLPFHVAYSYTNLIHWFLAGWGTYLYAKQMKLAPTPAFIASIIFTFGSAYGGAYYNMPSLKTICWFPLTLYFLERYLEKRQRRFLGGMVILIGQSIVAGYLQMAALTWMIFGIYVMVRVLVFPEVPRSWFQKIRVFGALAAVAIGALILAFPQIYLMFQLTMMSNRTGLEEGYAYVGSMSPLAFGTLINPVLSDLFRGNNLYAGAFSLFLVFLAIVSPSVRKSGNFRVWGVMGLITLLLSLGQWSPLYLGIIKLTKFYAFRVPAKFLGFFCFSFAMLGAAGFQSLWQGRAEPKAVKKAFCVYVGALTFFAACMIVTRLLLTVGRETALKIGKYFVLNYIFAKPGHPHSLESYLSTLEQCIDPIAKYFSFWDPVNVGMIAASALCVVLTAAFLRGNGISRRLLAAGILFLTVDLYAASFHDEQREFLRYQEIQGASPVFKILERERSIGRLGRIYGFRSQDQRLPLTPSQNMLYGIADVGAYSPLVTSRYYRTIGLFGNVNDSNFAVTPTPAFVTQRLSILSFLNVSHILSVGKLTHPDLTLMLFDPGSGVYLYANKSQHGRAHFITDVKMVGDWEMLRTEFLKEGFDPRKTVFFESSEAPRMTSPIPAVSKAPQATFRRVSGSPDREQWEVETDQPGFFILSDTMYPGWHAQVNGQEVPILYADGLFQGVWLSKPGHYRIDFYFSLFKKAAAEA